MTVTEQKSTETRLKKDVGIACQKVCKQGRVDIIVKVNLQSPIPMFIKSFIIIIIALQFRWGCGMDYIELKVRE